MPSDWAAIGRVPLPSPSGIATISGRSFTVSGRSGNIAEPGPQGFFHDDTRFLSGLRLLIDGIDPEVVDAASVEPGEAIFYLRSRTEEQGDHTEPGLLLRRHRYQSSTLHEDVILENRSGFETTVAIELEVQADFADLFDVRFAGPAPERDVRAQRADNRLVFSYQKNGFERSTELTTSRKARIEGNRIILTAHVPNNRRWKSCIDVIPVIDGERLPVEASCRTHRHKPEPLPGIVPSPPRLRSSADALEHLWAHSLEDLAALGFRMNGHRAFAAGIPWYVALFGRDSVITGLEAMMLDRDSALGTAKLLAEMQGTQDNPSISEEPGKILHEVRFGERSLAVLKGSRYYGSVDSTPLWCMLVGRLHRWGCEPRRLTELLPALRAATGWIERRLELRDGLLTYEGDPTRLVNQSWKDSFDSMVDVDGLPLDPPIAGVEVQGYAVAALREAARIEADLGDESREAGLLARADELVQRIEDRFWREDLGTFAMALGRDGQTADTASSNAGHLLWAGAVRPELADAVAASLVNDDLWSGWGVRTLSRRNPSYHPVSYHRGSVWPHDTMLCIAGLLRYDHSKEAIRLAGGLLAAAAHFSYQLPELFSGIGRDEVPYPVHYPTSSSPQAWAAAVPVYLTEQLLGIDPDVPQGKVVVAPKLPEGIELTIEGVRIGEKSLSVRAEGHRAQFLEIPSGLDVVVR